MITYPTSTVGALSISNTKTLVQGRSSVEGNFFKYI